jgi:uncharacterized protein involved in type VI secretion and phage assembly
MSASLYDTIQRIVRDEIARLRVAELGVVEAQHAHESDSDKDNYACTVRLRDSGLVLKQVPVATPRLGCVSVPEVGALVLLQFVGGDINAPIIVGSLYSDEDRPPVNAPGQQVIHLPLGAEDGDAVHLEISSTDARKAVLKLGEGLELTLVDDDPVVELSIDGGAASLTIARDGAVTLESQGDLAIKANSIQLEAQGELKLKGATINLN